MPMKRNRGGLKKKQRNRKIVYVVSVITITIILIGAAVAFVDRDNLPEYAYTTNRSEEAYKIAVEIPGILDKAKCYCGCDKVRNKQFPRGHQSLKHCYMDDKGRFSDHAVYCDMCMLEVFDIYEMYQDNVPADEIRIRIDRKYG